MLLSATSEVGVPNFRPSLREVDSELSTGLPNQETWREVRLVGEDPGDADLHVQLLRPISWIEKMNARPGQVVLIEIAELSFVGLLRVVEIRPCPPIDLGLGEVVTGRFQHVAREIVRVTVEGLKQPIGCTPQHPFWSETQQKYIPASKLQHGEILQALHGATARVLEITFDSTPQQVYNLEVHGRHEYRVTELGLLVHNASFTPNDNPLTLRALARAKEIISSMDESARGPNLTLLRDRQTGEIFERLNARSIEDGLDGLIGNRLAKLRNAVDAGEVNRYPFWVNGGIHSEMLAASDALRSRRTLGLAADSSALSQMEVVNVVLRGPNSLSVRDRCPYCLNVVPELIDVGF